LSTNIPSDSWTGGHGKGFMGFFGHQNTLASVLLFTLPGVIRTKYKGKSKKDKFFLSVILIFNLLFIILSYSRGVILSILFEVVVFLLLNKKWKVIGISAVALLLVSVTILINPYLNNFTSNILKKDFPEFYSSRMWMWEPSFEAALNGGFTGLGYGISDPNIKPGSIGDHYEGERFVREKGNSVLGLVEETGVIGLLFFILSIVYLILKNWDTRYLMPDKFSSLKNNLPESGIRNPVSSLLIASLSAFILHAQFEAWWVGVGSVQLPLFFIYVGLLINQPITQSSKQTIKTD
jgi:O-antigen ligase